MDGLAPHTSLAGQRPICRKIVEVKKVNCRNYLSLTHTHTLSLCYIQATASPHPKHSRRPIPLRYVMIPSCFLRGLLVFFDARISGPAGTYLSFLNSNPNKLTFLPHPHPHPHPHPSPQLSLPLQLTLFRQASVLGVYTSAPTIVTHPTAPRLLH